jgi:hypothetical protein
MRAILIDPFQKQMQEIDLSVEVGVFQQQVRTLLKTTNPQIIHANELLSVIYDETAHWKETPAFWSELLKDSPLFGNVLCVGRNPISKNWEDLYRLYEFENFKVKWCTN